MELMSRFLLIFWCFITIYACKNASEATHTSEAFHDFMVFYDQFHSDSLFQLEHITFPLQGLPSDLSSTKASNFRWEQESWEMHQPIDLSGEFERQFQAMDDEFIIEYIVHKTESYGMERRFAKLSDEWFLIYYAALNRIRINEQTQ